MPLSEQTKLTFYNVMQGELPMQVFEQWVYNHVALEQELSPDEYLALISFNYKQAGAKYELFKLLGRYVSLGAYETHKIKQLLAKAKVRNSVLPRVLEQLYDLYCNGYDFLENIGMGYGLTMTYLTNYGGKHWSNLTGEQLTAMVAAIPSSLAAEVDHIEQWLDTGKIILTGERDELGQYNYIDHRTMTERNTFMPDPVSKLKARKRLWQWLWNLRRISVLDK